MVASLGLGLESFAGGSVVVAGSSEVAGLGFSVVSLESLVGFAGANVIILSCPWSSV